MEIFLILFISVIFGAICAGIASSKERNAVGWFFVGFFFWLIGLIIILALPSESRPNIYSSDTYLDRMPTPYRPPAQPLAPSVSYQAAPPKPVEDEGAKRWRVLKEVDPEIGGAAARMAKLGPDYEKELADKFLTLNDKSYLPAIEAQLTTKAEEARRAADERIAQLGAENAASSEHEMAVYRKLLNDRGGVDPQTGSKVIGFAPYLGSWKTYHGGIIVHLANGQVLLRKGVYGRPFASESEVA